MRRKEQFGLTVHQSASEIINGFKRRYLYDQRATADEKQRFSVHENIIREIFQGSAKDRVQNLMFALVDCLLDDFREIKLSSRFANSIEYPISINDVLASIDGSELDSRERIRGDVLQVARNTCSYYIERYLDLPAERKDQNGPKYGDFLMATTLLRTFNQYTVGDGFTNE